MVISHQEASNILWVAQCSLYTSRKYKPFLIRKSDKNKALFDITGYEKEESKMEIIARRPELFIEYMYSELGIPYTQIAQKSKVHVQNIHNHRFGFDGALRIFKNMSEYVGMFDKYYGFVNTLGLINE